MPGLDEPRWSPLILFTIYVSLAFPLPLYLPICHLLTYLPAYVSTYLVPLYLLSTISDTQLEWFINKETPDLWFHHWSLLNVLLWNGNNISEKTKNTLLLSLILLLLLLSWWWWRWRRCSDSKLERRFGILWYLGTSLRIMCFLYCHLTSFYFWLFKCFSIVSSRKIILLLVCLEKKYSLAIIMFNNFDIGLILCCYMFTWFLAHSLRLYKFLNYKLLSCSPL